MIATDLEHAERRLPATPSFRKALAFLRRPDLRSLPEGRADIDGDAVFALPQSYDTVATDAPKFELHRNYIDIQFIVTGEEVIGWVPAERMQVTEPYDAAKDIAFGTAQRNDWAPVVLRPGDLAVLYPEDGHAPRLAAGGPCRVFKIVVKVAV